MTDRVEVEAQFPGSTAAEAYAKALEMLETPGALGFTPHLVYHQTGDCVLRRRGGTNMDCDVEGQTGLID